MVESRLQEAEQLIREIEAALARSAPDQAQAASQALDQLLRNHAWPRPQLHALRTALQRPRSDSTLLRERLLAELRVHRRTRGHLTHYQKVGQGY
ncbi:MAG: hypothetical protein AAGG11_21800 [Pseudomonadota bacterium]